jgi:hypothetical protein
MLSGKAANTNFIVFGLTIPELEPMIHRTRREHANHYITDAFLIPFDVDNDEIMIRII